MSKPTPIAVKDKGSALIIALVFLLVMTLIGTTAMQGTSQQENMAGNVRDRNLAFQSAEAALRAAERWLRAQATPPTNFGATPGLLLVQTAGFWVTYNWNTQSLYNNNTTTPPTAPPLMLTQVSQQPSYVIENMNNVNVFCLTDPTLNCYRITARGVGGSPNAIVILQSTYFRL